MPTAELDAKSSRTPLGKLKSFLTHTTLFLPGTQVPLDIPELSWFFMLEQRWGEVKVVWILKGVSSLNDDDWQTEGIYQLNSRPGMKLQECDPARAPLLR